MDRSEIMEMMAALQLSGMRAAYDEIVTTGIKRKLEASRGRSTAVLEAPALVAGLDDVAVVREPVQ